MKKKESQGQPKIKCQATLTVCGRRAYAVVNIIHRLIILLKFDIIIPTGRGIIHTLPENLVTRISFLALTTNALYSLAFTSMRVTSSPRRTATSSSEVLSQAVVAVVAAATPPLILR